MTASSTGLARDLAEMEEPAVRREARGRAETAEIEGGVSEEQAAVAPCFWSSS